MLDKPRDRKDGLIEAAELLIKWSNNLCDEGRRGTATVYGYGQISLDDPAKIYASQTLATIAHELRSRAGSE